MMKFKLPPIVTWILFGGAAIGIGITLYLLFQGRLKEIKHHEITIQDMQRSRNPVVEAPDSLKAKYEAKLAGLNDVEKENQVAELESQTDTLLEMLDGITKDLEQIAELEPGTNMLNNPRETLTNYQYWMKEEQANAGRGSGKAIELRDSLEGYVDWANQFCAEIVAGNNGDPEQWEPFPSLTALSGSNGNSTWEYVTFHHQTVAENLEKMDALRRQIKGIRYGCLDVILQ